MLREIYHRLLPVSVREKLNIGSRMRRVIKKITFNARKIDNKKIAISEVNILGNKFFWCSDIHGMDDISVDAQRGVITLEASLMPIIAHKCRFLDVGANIGKICLAMAACGGGICYRSVSCKLRFINEECLLK